ncbi:arylamine N-acetyltransferase [Sporosarcina sp. Marseille-Q4063]|uniref:arylamine N-acetyltransferase family protein n=1 Tax=Sporosarcina sp. Marseille-Q4063 TaxID=2810514 RepID=UPI001BB0540F|nr:arylamine N-acetyltransferase [Sporosarcina sp. Marseille-Q4063]QUW22421.1 arylamine N-acetyltransferase [Sporosarcina sp. Marseille-Q4063]
MDIELYLKRFHALSFKEVSLQNLGEIQNLHLEHIPFENLDVIRRIPIYLNLKTIYEKIVMKHRGGYCYEVNGLFHALLCELGYDAHLVSATVLRQTGEWAKADTHAAILVNLEEPYLVDVGFGAACPRLPVPLNGDKKVDVNAAYTITQINDRQFDLVYESDKEQRTLYRFNNEPKNLLDFHEGCVFNQVSKDSSFTHHDVITKATPTGRVTLTDQTLTIIENDLREKVNLSESEKQQTLRDIFNIQL